MDPLLIEPFDMEPVAWSDDDFILSWSPVDIDPLLIELLDMLPELVLEPFDMFPFDVD